MKQVIVYAGKHYGQVHLVTKTDQSLLLVVHEPSGDMLTVPMCDVAAVASSDLLAAAFRNAPASPAHNHVDVYNAIERIGGRAAIAYGMFIATPFRQRWKKRDRGLAVAAALELANAPHERTPDK